MNLYIYHRAEGFYPMELHDNTTARQQAIQNPGTLKVSRLGMSPGVYGLVEETIWDAAEKLPEEVKP